MFQSIYIYLPISHTRKIPNVIDERRIKNPIIVKNVYFL